MPTPTGLSAADAAARLQSGGANELGDQRRRTGWHIAGEVVREPMFALLLVAGAIYLVLGDGGDAAMLLAFVFVSMGITVFQEHKTERLLETLRDLSSPRALVIRDGARLRIAGREVVCGDLLVLEEGDRIAADGLVLESHDLMVDESLLTGESLPVRKQQGETLSPDASAADTSTQVFSGSMIVQGGGLARVLATGPATRLGQIGLSLQNIKPEASPLQHEIGTLVRRFALFGLLLSGLVFFLYGLQRGDWLAGLLVGITLAMSVLPEEFTVILTVFMALGAWRISRYQVLTRHAPVIEALGSATVLCVDKTGTLTRNNMSVAAVVANGQTYVMDDSSAGAWPPAVLQVMRCAVLASEVQPFDAMERALHARLEQIDPATLAGYGGWAFVHEYPLSAGLLAMTHVWQEPGDSGQMVATKGAPEAIARLCRLDAQATAMVLASVEVLAAQGQRVLAVAQTRPHAAAADPAWPETVDAMHFEWLGLVSLSDPLRPGVPDAVRECHQAGIRVVMITGDYPATAAAIGRAAGIPDGRIMSGVELDTLDAAGLAAAVRDVHIFARIQPEQKLRLVEAFKADGEVVAMTGDGVNDAPALRAAHIGIAMGARGTDVAREAASLVLLNDDFTSIVHAVRLGRRIYDNLRKALIYVVAVHLPIAGMTLLPLVFGTPLAFAPVHIVFLEMIINPACALVFESEAMEADIMSRPPRRVDATLFGMRSMSFALLQGVGLFCAAALTFLLALQRGMTADQARGLAFACVVLGNLLLIVSSRSSQRGALALLATPNRAMWWIIGGTLLALSAVLGVPVLRNIFHFGATGLPELGGALLAGLATLLWFEVLKRIYRRGAAAAAKAL